MVNFGLLAAETGPVVWAPQQFSTGFASWQRYCSDVAQRKPTKLCTVFGRLLCWYMTYTFSGFLPVKEFCQVQYLLCVQVLRSALVFWQRYCTALQQWASAKLCGAEHSAPPIFGRATITLGIGPHSSYRLF